MNEKRYLKEFSTGAYPEGERDSHARYAPSPIVDWVDFFTEETRLCWDCSFYHKFCGPQICQKCVGGRGSAPTPAPRRLDSRAFLCPQCKTLATSLVQYHVCPPTHHSCLTMRTQSPVEFRIGCRFITTRRQRAVFFKLTVDALRAVCQHTMLQPMYT